MEKIEAIIRPFVLDQVCEELSGMRVHRIIATEVKTFEEEREYAKVYWQEGTAGRRSRDWDIESHSNYHAKIKLEVVVPESMAKRVIATIFRAAKTSERPDVKITRSVVEKVIGSVGRRDHLIS